MPANAPVKEIGYTQAPNYNWWLYDNETTPELIWPQSVYVYDQMRRTDSQVGSVLRAVTETLLRTPWRIDPAGARARVVKFVADDLGLPIVGKKPTPPPRLKDRFSWASHLREALLMLPYGHSYFEQVYRVDDGGNFAHLRKLAYRPAKTIERIDVAPDGGLIAIKQYWTQVDTEPKPIPVDRLVAYIHAKEGGNWLGTSILRNCYKNWLLKDRLLRVQAQTIERNGMGIPLYTAAETEESLAAGLGMATSWRAGEAAGSAIPFGASLKLVGVEGTLPDAQPVIDYHDSQIARAVLAHFLNLGQQTGSWALGTTFADFFTMSLQTLAEQIRDTATQHIVEDLVDINFGEAEPAPRLVFDEIGSRQAATAAALKTLVDAGILHPDQVLEESSRQQYGLPPADPTTATPPPGVAPAAAPVEPTTMGDLSVAAKSSPTEAQDNDEQAIRAAAGVDTHPGGEQLKHWWVYGPGAARWATFTELYRQLREEIKGKSDDVVKAIAASWFHLRYGYWPGDHRNLHASADPVGAEPEPDDEADEWEMLIAALVVALAEISGSVAAAFDPAKHPRGAGGKFRSTVDKLKEAISTHRSGGGKGDPFADFDREQLRRAAKTRGISLGRGEDRDSIAKKLLSDLDEPAPAVVPKEPAKAVKRAPRKKAEPKPKPAPDKPTAAPTPKPAPPTSAHYTGPMFKYSTPAKETAAREALALQIDSVNNKLSAEGYGRLEDIEIRAGFTDAERDHIRQEALIAANVEAWRASGAPHIPDAEFKAGMGRRSVEAWTGKPIAVRVTHKALAGVLKDGRFKSQFETNKSNGLLDKNVRGRAEEKWFGLAPDSDPAKRPIYGYVAVEGVRNVNDHPEQYLNQYGTVQVVLKDSVRARTTAMWGDSLNQASYGIPEPVDSPTWRSYTLALSGVGNGELVNLDRDTDSVRWREWSFVEAQIHDGVSTDDIAEVILDKNPTAAVQAALGKAGIPWRVA